MLGTIQSIGVFLCFFLGFKGLVNAVHIVILVLRTLWYGIVPYDKGVCKGIGSLLNGIMWLIFGLLRFFGYSKPFAFGSHYLGKERFILFRQLGVLLQIGNELLTPETQTLHLLSVVVLALLFPLWDKGAVRG